MELIVNETDMRVATLFLVAVDVPDENDRARVLDVFKAHGGHRVNVYGKWTVEGLSS